MTRRNFRLVLAGKTYHSVDSFHELQVLKTIDLDFRLFRKIVMPSVSHFSKVVRLGKLCRTVQTVYSGAKPQKPVFFHLGDHCSLVIDLWLFVFGSLSLVLVLKT